MLLPRCLRHCAARYGERALGRAVDMPGHVCCVRLPVTGDLPDEYSCASTRATRKRVLRANVALHDAFASHASVHAQIPSMHARRRERWLSRRMPWNRNGCEPFSRS